MSDIINVRAAYVAQKPVEGSMRSRSGHAPIELRAEDDGSFVLEGYPSLTGAAYSVRDYLGEYDEMFTRGSFNKALSERDDVRLLVNHDGLPLARTASRTLALREITDPADDPQGRGQTGLWMTANVDGNSSLGKDVRSAVQRGDMGEMSFAFQATRQKWNADYSERTVEECRLVDVSVVTYPMNPLATVNIKGERMAGLMGRVREGRAMTTDDTALLSRLLGFLAAIDAVVDEATELVEVTLDPASEVMDDDSEEMSEMAPRDAEIDAELRRRRLAIWKARNAS